MRAINGVVLGLLLVGCAHPAAVTPAEKTQLRDGWLVALRSDVDRLAGADGFQGGIRALHGGKVELDREFGDTRCLPLGLGRRLLATVAVAGLVEEGKMSFEDRVGRLLPAVRGTSLEPVEVAHLLTNSAALAPAPGATVEESLVAARQAPLIAAPGSRTDSADPRPWLLLEQVVTAVGGQPFEAQVQERVLRRAGASGTSLGHTADCPGVTGGVSTVDDQMRVADALRSGRLLQNRILDVLWTPRFDLAPGSSAGLGFVIRTGEGGRAVGLGSAGTASAYELWIDPATGDTLALLGASTAKTAQAVRTAVTEFFGLPPPLPHSTSTRSRSR